MNLKFAPFSHFLTETRQNCCRNVTRKSLSVPLISSTSWFARSILIERIQWETTEMLNKSLFRWWEEETSVTKRWANLWEKLSRSSIVDLWNIQYSLYSTICIDWCFSKYFYSRLLKTNESQTFRFLIFFSLFKCIDSTNKKCIGIFLIHLFVTSVFYPDNSNDNRFCISILTEFIG